MIDSLDLCLLKGILESNSRGIEFSIGSSYTLFLPGDAQTFAKLVLEYIRTYRSVPTRRTLSEMNEDSETLVACIARVWDELDKLQYDTKEYSFDLERAKDRYQIRTLARVKATLNDYDEDRDPYSMVKKSILELQEAHSVKNGRAHIQKSVADYLPEFEERYDAAKQNIDGGVSVLTHYSLIDAVTGGLSPAEMLIVAAETNGGKALGIDTPIITPSGWRTMGELKPGDYVFGDDGKPCRVIATSGVMYDHECYELKFSDGAKIIADAGHFWETYTFSERVATLRRTDEYRAKMRLDRAKIRIKKAHIKGLKNKPYIPNPAAAGPCLPIPVPKARTTEEISKTIVCSKIARRNHSIRAAKPLSFTETNLEIDPYLFGVWLGDGTHDAGEVTSSDPEIIKYYSEGGYNVAKSNSAKYRWSIYRLITQLRAIGVYKNKHIPLQYLLSSFEQRLALAQGLMDTDGTVNKGSGECQFDNTSVEIIEGMQTLLRSLGIITNCHKKQGKLYGKICKMSYRISFKTELPMFRLTRKLELQKRTGFKHVDYRFINSAQKVKSVPVQCIQVDSKSSCYLCGKEMIPTHNSMMLNNLAIQMWAQTNTIDAEPVNFVRGYNILYFTLEMPYIDCYDRFLARVAGVPQRGITKATLDEAQMMRVRRAKRFIEQYQEAGYYFDIVDVPRNVTIDEIELRYNDALLRYRPDIVVVDYMGLMHDPKMAREQDWLKMGAIAGSLHEFARVTNTIMLTAVQLTDIKRGSGGGSRQDDQQQKVGVHRVGRSSHIMHHANLGVQIETRANEMSYPDLKYHIIKNRKGPLGQGNMIKNFQNASLIDVPVLQDSDPSNISGQTPSLLKKVQDSLSSK